MFDRFFIILKKIWGWMENKIKDRYFVFKQTIIFIGDFLKFKRLSQQCNRHFALLFENSFPCLCDKTKKTNFDRHYVYHPAWAMQIIVQVRPIFHVDISSTLPFVAMLSTILPVKFYDYRPPSLSLPNLTTGFADLLNLPFEDKSIHSISCMHVVEHIGLGRYGEPLDPDGDVKAMRELQRVVANKGILLFVVPVGKQQIMFNAHRIYSAESIVKYFPELVLKEFSLIPESPEDGHLVKNPTKHLLDKQTYGCGCFLFCRE